MRNGKPVKRFRPSATRSERPDSVQHGNNCPEAERDAILVAVKDENPGLGRWKNMLEPLCLSELETRMKAERRRDRSAVVVS